MKIRCALVVLFVCGLTSPGWAGEPTVLQKHVMFFDHNGDGRITVSETTKGLRQLGIGRLRAAAMATVINGGLGRATGSSDPLTILVANIHLGKHGSDTDIFDAKGNFDPAKFEELFHLYDENRDDELSEEELEAFFERNKDPGDTVGSFGSKAEFSLLLEIAGEDRYPQGGSWWPWAIRVLPRQRLLQFYDGSLFFKLTGKPMPF